MSLVRAEAVRFGVHPFVRVTLGMCLVVAAVLAGVTVWNARPVTSSEVAAARGLIAHEVSLPGFRAAVRRCEHRHGGLPAAPSVSAHCRKVLAPPLRNYLPHKGTLSDAARSGPGLVIGLLVLAEAFLIGCILAGADWASGSIENQLLVDPRRLRWWLAKGVAWSGAVAMAAGATLVVFWVPVLLATRRWGWASADGIESLVAPAILRTVGVAAALCMLALALTTLTRSALGGVGLLVGLWLVTGPALAAMGGSAAHSLSNNLVATVRGDYQVYDRSLACADPTCRLLRTIHATNAVGEVFITTLVLAAAALVAFRRRDV